MEATEATPLDPAAAESWPIWWWALPAAVLLAIAAAAILKRRKKAEPEARGWQEAVDTPPVPEAGRPSVAPAPDPVPAPPSAPMPPVAEPAPPPCIDLAFEPTSLRLSLVYATLQYRLTLTASTDLGAAHLLGDMIGAHGSLTPEQQLAPAIDELMPLKPVPAMAAGETVELKGEIQLPLGAIRPVKQGQASLFVPLVRLCLAFAEGEVLRRVYTLGGESAGGGLAPLRLDTGPQEHRDLTAREIEAARAYPASPASPRAAVG